MGYSALRFNFRGVGASEGTYDDGCGELDDLRAAADVLAGLAKLLPIWPVIPSAPGSICVSIRSWPQFANWCWWRLRPRIWSSIPLAELVVIAGDHDSFAPLDLLRKQIPLWYPSGRLHVLPGTDHFYQGALDRLAGLLDAVLTGTPGQEPPPDA